MFSIHLSKINVQCFSKALKPSTTKISRVVKPQEPYLLHLVIHLPLLFQYLSLLAHQRPLLLTEEPLQLLDLVLLAPEGLNQLLLALRQLQLQHKRVLRREVIRP